jgi:hypothetical protein
MKEIYLDGNRWYEIETARYPSVNTILFATESPEAKRRLANWKHKQLEKFLNANRTCQNCAHFIKGGCAAGEKLRSPLTKKHRCKSFAPIDAVSKAREKHMEAARSRGTAVHQHIENYFQGGDLPTSGTCKYSSQITYLLKNFNEGKILIECAVFSAVHRFAGRVDFCGEYQDQIVVADWVTTDRSYLQRDHFERKFLQCAGYALAIAEMKLTIPTEIIVVAMSPTGAELFREPLDKWAELWLKRVEQFWENQAMLESD